MDLEKYSFYKKTCNVLNCTSVVFNGRIGALQHVCACHHSPRKGGRCCGVDSRFSQTIICMMIITS